MNKIEEHSYATLCIHSTKLGAKDIAEALNMQGGKLQEIGQPVSSRLGSRLADHSTWQLSSRIKENVTGIDDEESIREHIEFLVRIMEQKQDAFKLLESECEFDIWCFMSGEKSNRGFDLGHDLIRRLSKFPVDLIFDIYLS
jgi:hypothetical protein